MAPGQPRAMTGNPAEHGERPMPTDEQYAARPIAFYLHCEKCLRENARPQDISAGLDHQSRMVIWCNRHEEPVVTVTLKNPPKLECAECEAEKPAKTMADRDTRAVERKRHKGH